MTKPPVADDITGAPKKRGRPSRDIADVCNEEIDEVVQCARDEKYFGERGNFRRSLDRHLKDLKSTLAADPPTPELLKLKKRFESAIAITRAWSKSCSFTDEVGQQFKSITHFCSLEPVVEPPFPLWLRRDATWYVAEATRIRLHASLLFGT